VEENSQSNLRLDQYLKNSHTSLSRSYLSKLIDRGNVTVNGETVTKPRYLVKPTDKVRVKLTSSHKKLKKLDLKVIYEDKDVVVIDKPTGVLAHSKGDFNEEETVATWLASRTKASGGNRAGIVHRLDRATSGVMICAKNSEAQAWLQKQFSTRKTKKTYLAVVNGRLSPETAVIDMAIERNPKKPQTFRVGINGKNAVTKYQTLKSGDKYSLVELAPLTGRTHQLRVHLANLSHPVVGDELYKGPKADRLYLHAHKLEITLPDKTRKEFISKVPPKFNKILG